MTRYPVTVSQVSAGRAGDFHQVMAACFQVGASDCWSVADLADILSLENCYGYSAETSAGKSTGKSRDRTGFIVVRVAGDEAEILTLGVLPAHHRSGIGRALVAAAMADPRAARVDRWFLEVRVDNNPAIRLYEALGFRAAEKRPDYYRDAHGDRSDALTMHARCPPASQPVSPQARAVSDAS